VLHADDVLPRLNIRAATALRAELAGYDAVADFVDALAVAYPREVAQVRLAAWGLGELGGVRQVHINPGSCSLCSALCCVKGCPSSVRVASLAHGDRWWSTERGGGWHTRSLCGSCCRPVCSAACARAKGGNARVAKWRRPEGACIIG